MEEDQEILIVAKCIFTTIALSPLGVGCGPLLYKEEFPITKEYNV